MAGFDADAFNNTTYEAETSTAFVPVSEDPNGYLAVIEESDKPLHRQEFQNKEGELFYSGTVNFEIIGPEAALKREQERTGMKKPRVRLRVPLDFTPEGHLDMGPGKNVKLGLLRAAVRQNNAQKKWAPRMLSGQGPLKIWVKHERPKDAAPGDDRVFVNVERFIHPQDEQAAHNAKQKKAS